MGLPSFLFLSKRATALTPMEMNKLPDGVATYSKYLKEFYIYYSNPNIMASMKKIWDDEVTEFPLPDFQDSLSLYAHFLVNAGERCAFMRLIVANPSLKPSNVPDDVIKALEVNSDYPLEKKPDASSKGVNLWNEYKKDIIDFFQVSYRVSNFSSKWNSSNIKSDFIPLIENGYKGAPLLHDWIGKTPDPVSKALSLFLIEPGLSVYQIPLKKIEEIVNVPHNQRKGY